MSLYEIIKIRETLVFGIFEYRIFEVELRKFEGRFSVINLIKYLT